MAHLGSLSTECHLRVTSSRKVRLGIIDLEVYYNDNDTRNNDNNDDETVKYSEHVSRAPVSIQHASKTSQTPTLIYTDET